MTIEHLRIEGDTKEIAQLLQIAFDIPEKILVAQGEHCKQRLSHTLSAPAWAAR